MHTEDLVATTLVADAEVGQVVQLRAPGEVHRGLKSRHVQLIALGGSIGTGLFVGSGATLALTGPGE